MTLVWTWIETTADGIAPASLELLTKARALGDTVEAVALGPGATDAAETVGAHGATTLHAADDELLAEPTSRVAAHTLAALARDRRPDVLLFPSSYRARDVAGRLQAITGSTLMANAVDLPSADVAKAEILGGTTVVDVALAGPPPHLVLLRPRSFDPEEVGGTAEVEPVAVVTPEGFAAVDVVARADAAASGPSLDDAKVVLAGGRGLGGPDGFALLDDLAAAIGGAAIGASRAAVDAGWVPYAMQIGQTGSTVKPEVYLAAGISGALQHAVGMKASRRIVAITKDAEAPILRLADLGVVGDLFQVLPALTEEVRRRTGR
jgi:electron transfer flavoprotein alpha subunit